MKAQKKIQTQTQESKAWPKVAIIVLNWNGWQDTIECLESLQRLTYPNYQIIVVDNGSTDDSVEKIKAWARDEIPVMSKFCEYDPSTKPVQWIEYDRTIAEVGWIPEEVRIKQCPSNQRMILIKTNENLGYGGGNNVGIRYALKTGAEYVLLLNNDTVVNPDFLIFLVQIAEGDTRCSLMGAKIYYYSEPNRIWFAGGRYSWYKEGKHIGYGKYDNGMNYQGVKSSDWITGCALLVPKEILQKIGLLDENFFLYGEDTDFSRRAIEAGFSCKVNLNTYLWHKVGSSTGLSSQSPLAYYYGTRNRLYYHHKHAQSSIDNALFFLLFLMVRLVRSFQWLLTGRADLIKATWRGVTDYIKGRLGRSSYYGA